MSSMHKYNTNHAKSLIECHRCHKFGHKTADCRIRFIPGFIDDKKERDMEYESNMNNKRRIDSNLKYVDIRVITNRVI